MDSELGAALESVLSDPEKVEKLSQMAQELFGDKTVPAGTGESREGSGAAASPPRPADDKVLSALGRAFSGKGEPSRSTALLLAMRPYMRPEKQEKLDRAIQIARMANIAGAVMRQYGGDGHGL